MSITLEVFTKLLKEHSEKVKSEDRSINEEMTKHSLILPLLQILGYDVFNTKEVVPEFTADIGERKGERVDYAIKLKGEPKIIIEAKRLGATLSNKQMMQLYRYFNNTDAELAILTNGDDYWFYSDRKKTNIMDTKPFFALRMSAIKDHQIKRLYEYSKEKVLEQGAVVTKSSNFMTLWERPIIRKIAKIIIGLLAATAVTLTAFGHIHAPVGLQACAVILFLAGLAIFSDYANDYSENNSGKRRKRRRRR